MSLLPDTDGEPVWPDAHEASFAAIYQTEAPGLLRYFARQTGNFEEARDLAQEAMLRFLRTGLITEVISPQAYLRRIATNLLRDRSDHGATKLAAASVPLIEGLDFEDDVDQHRELSGREELAEWRKILSQLKPRTLEIFLLSRVDDMTYKQIADHFGMTIWNVHRHMRKAIAHVERNRRAR